MRTAKTLIRLGGCPGWSESSLCAHSFCWFCHVAAQFLAYCCSCVCLLHRCWRMWYRPAHVWSRGKVCQQSRQLHVWMYVWLSGTTLWPRWVKSKCAETYCFNWASSRENLSLGFATRWDSNRPARLQKIASLEFLDIASRGIILSKQRKQRRWSDCADVQADLRLCCSHML